MLGFILIAKHSIATECEKQSKSFHFLSFFFFSVANKKYFLLYHIHMYLL